MRLPAGHREARAERQSPAAADPALRADPMTARRSPLIVRSPARTGSSVPPGTPGSPASGHLASRLP
jgi:hypothetical protein